MYLAIFFIESTKINKTWKLTVMPIKGTTTAADFFNAEVKTMLQSLNIPM